MLLMDICRAVRIMFCWSCGSNASFCSLKRGPVAGAGAGAGAGASAGAGIDATGWTGTACSRIGVWFALLFELLSVGCIIICCGCGCGCGCAGTGGGGGDCSGACDMLWRTFVVT